MTAGTSPMGGYIGIPIFRIYPFYPFIPFCDPGLTDRPDTGYDRNMRKRISKQLQKMLVIFSAAALTVHVMPLQEIPAAMPSQGDRDEILQEQMFSDTKAAPESVSGQTVSISQADGTVSADSVPIQDGDEEKTDHSAVVSEEDDGITEENENEDEAARGYLGVAIEDPEIGQTQADVIPGEISPTDSAPLIFEDSRTEPRSTYAAGSARTVKPAPPSSMELSAVDHTSVTIYVRTAYDVPQCEIYRSTDQKKGYERIASTKTGYYQDRGLTLGKTYHYKSRSYIVVSGKRIYSTYTKSRAYTPALSAPPNAAADPDGTDRIRVTWAKTPGASGYRILRADKRSGPYKALAVVKGLSYVDTKAGADICRYYKIRPYYTLKKKKVYGPASDICSAKAYFAPPVVQGLSHPSYTSLKLTWRQMHGKAMTEVSCADSPYGVYKILTVTSKGTYTHTGLTPGQTYHYRLRTYKLVNGKKVYTDYSQISGQVSLPTVTKVKAASTGINKIKLRWDAVPGATVYYIYHSEKQGSGYSKRGETTKTSFTDTNLLTGGQYFYTVQAFRILDGCYAYGEDSAPVLAIPDLVRPSSVKCQAVSKKKLRLTWKKNSEAAGYEIWRSTKKKSGYKKVGTTKKPTFTNSGLSADKIYHYKIRAYTTVDNERIYSPWSSITKGKTKKR